MSNKQLTKGKGFIRDLVRLFFRPNCTYRSFFSLFSFLFFLLFACRGPFDLPLGEKPVGKAGAFSLTIDGVRTGRTILPATVQGDFAAYTMEFFAEGTTVNPLVTADRTNANISNPVNIDAGNYDLYVTAFMDALKTKPAARGALTGIAVTSGASVSRSLTLYAITGEGEGTFRWKIAYPNNVIEAGMTIVPLDEESGTPQQTLFFTGGTPAADTDGSLTLNAGYYRVVFILSDDSAHSTERREILHVYQNMESFFEYTFTQGHFTYLVVMSGANDGPGTLRQAIGYAPEYSTIIIDESVGTIVLTGELGIYKNLTIAGNGVIITRDTNGGNFWLLYFGSSATVTINRVWFKDGRRNSDGGAIFSNNNCNLTFESCIFSDNWSSNGGGAIICYGTTIFKGCTFYGNSAGYGGAIYAGNNLFLEGNLFYGNTSVDISHPVVYRHNGTRISNGYNVVDVPLGTGGNESGWDVTESDITISSLPVSPVSFRLLQGSGAANIITTLPEGYPAVDFYGYPITVPAAAGAVQAFAAGIGNVVDYAVNNGERGSVTVSPEPDSDGIVSGLVTITANPVEGFELGHWLVGGNVVDPVNPLELPLADFTKVKAVFVKLFIVNNFSDAGGSENVPGTLRHALNNAIDNDIVRLNGVTPGETSIMLSSGFSINKSITIEGNGITLTPGNISNWDSHILSIGSSAAVTISRVWFRDSRYHYYGGAVYNNHYGNLTLESCIFSSNWSGNGGGAIMNWSNGIITAKGCTFYGNTGGYGGVVYTDGRLDFVGNLFYGNSAIYNYPVVNTNGPRNSLGYNVVDMPFGTGSYESGWEAVPTDTTISSENLPVSPINFKLLPGSGAANVITSRPAGYPTIDFYGNAIAAPAAAGAVQAWAGDGGSYLALSVNNEIRGSVNVSPPLNAEGFASGPVTLTAVPEEGFELGYWLVNGSKAGYANPLPLPMADHTIIEAVFLRVFIVDNFMGDYDSRYTPGTLRYALDNVDDDDVIRLSGVQPGQTTIAISDQIYINKSITIEGNGVIITGASGYQERPLYVNNFTAVTISRVWFKDNRANWDYGGAIYNSGGNVTLESCIFSGNRAGYDGSGYGGGAILIQNNGIVTVKACTFYGNSATHYGAIYRNGGNVFLEGNLFYGNTADTSYPVMNGGTSNGYNVVDAPLGNNNNESGWDAAATDKAAAMPMVSPVNFWLLPGSAAANVIAALPEGYPTVDFYGNAINAPAAAGAVQSAISGTGKYLELKVNNSERGSASASPEPDANGFVPGSVTLTASPEAGYELDCWLVNGEKTGSASPWHLTLADHAVIEAVFIKMFIVDNFSDENLPGTLRHALGNAIDGDTIRLSGVTPGQTSIALTGNLIVNKNITIEGNDITITRDPSWPVNWDSRLLYIEPNVTVTVSHVWFKDGRADGYGSAVYNNGGTVTLEYCTFSGNQSNNEGGAVFNVNNGTMFIKGSAFHNNMSNGHGGAIRSSSGNLAIESSIFNGNQANYGGAISNNGYLTAKGCTFYRNNAVYHGGAIYNGNTLIIEGNLFYGNTYSNSYYPVVTPWGNSPTSNGCNVVDVPLGTGYNESGWTPAATDVTFADLGITGIPFDTETFSPVSALGTVIPSAPAGFPATDFFGNARSFPGAPGAVAAFAKTITFNANGGTPEPEVQAIASGGKIAEPQPMSRTGYLFDGWYRENTFATKWNFAVNTVSSDATLYAKWNPITYTVIFNKNSPEASGSMANDVHTYDSEKSLIPNAFSYYSFLFVGWNTEADGTGTAYTNSQTIKNLRETNGATVTLYAQWFVSSFTTVINFSQIADAAPEIAGPVIYRSSANGQVSATISLGNPEQYSSIEWYISGTNVRGSGPSFTITTVNTIYRTAGEYFLTVEVIKGGFPYNKTVTFTVEE